MNTNEPLPDPNTPPPMAPAPGAAVRHRRRVTPRVIAVVVVVASLVTAGTVVAVAATATEREAQGDPAEHPHAPTETTNDGATPSGDGGGVGRAHGRHHEPLPPYEDRYAAATDGDRAAADGLLADVRATLAGYAAVDAAAVAGYRAPATPRGPLHHYYDPGVAAAGAVLDPSRPNGLVYYTVEGADPVLLGAFFVARRGTSAPRPAGDLVIWHSHSPRCAGFFVTVEEPCEDTLRLVHVWTVDEIDLRHPRTGEAVRVRVTDPFGAPFRAAVRPAS